MAFAQIDQPSWQVLPCPRWCTEEHREDDFDEDRRHSAQNYIPIVRVGRAPDDTGRWIYSFEPTELMVVPEMLDSESAEAWLTIAETEVEGHAQAIRLSVESAVRLAGALLRDTAVLSSRGGQK